MELGVLGVEVYCIVLFDRIQTLLYSDVGGRKCMLWHGCRLLPLNPRQHEICLKRLEFLEVIFIEFFWFFANLEERVFLILGS